MASRQSDLTYDRAAAITLHDTNAIERTRAIYVGVAGDVKATLSKGGTVTFKALPVGIHKIAATVVFSTGTTATDLVALY
jgi:hypothetical protein